MDVKKPTKYMDISSGIISLNDGGHSTTAANIVTYDRQTDPCFKGLCSTKFQL